MNILSVINIQYFFNKTTCGTFKRDTRYCDDRIDAAELTAFLLCYAHYPC